MSVKFDTTPTDATLIADIADRYLTLIGHADNLHMRLEIQMDLTACHLNGTPLKLQELLEAGEFELAHDIQGIGDHLDRTTGKLKPLSIDGDTPAFLPRFAKPETKKAA